MLSEPPYMLDPSLLADPWYGIPTIRILEDRPPVGEVFLPSFLLSLAIVEDRDAARWILQRIFEEHAGVKRPAKWYLDGLLDSLSRIGETHPGLAYPEPLRFDPVRDASRWFEARLGEVAESRELRQVWEIVGPELTSEHPIVGSLLAEELLFMARRSSLAAARGILTRHLQRIGLAVVNLPKKLERARKAKVEFFEERGLGFLKTVIEVLMLVTGLSLTGSHLSIALQAAIVVFDP